MMQGIDRGYIDLVNSFVGETIESIYYYDDYEGSYQQYAEYNSYFHDVAIGADIVMQSGRVLGITHGGKLASFHVDIQDSALEWPKDFEQIKRYNVTQHPMWQPLIGNTITTIDTHWSWWTIEAPENKFGTEQLHESHAKQLKIDIPEDKRKYYPDDLVFSFQDNAKLFISAVMYLEDYDFFVLTLVNLSIVFDEATAKRYGFPFTTKYE